MYKIGSKRYGHLFNWESLTAIFAPKNPEETYQKLTAKFMKYAAKASFTNPFIRRCLAADPSKGPYSNNLTSGCAKDGEVISLASIAKENAWAVNTFREALSKRIDWNSYRFRFRGYDASLAVRPYKDGDTNLQPGDVYGYLNMEYKDCGNGHYYLLINDDNFIYVDMD